MSKSVSVTISPAILHWVMNKKLKNTTDISLQEQLHHWLSGEKKPTFNQVEAVSRKTNIPLGYFFMKTPPHEQCNLIEYRTIDSIESTDPSENLLATVHQMTLIQDWMRHYLIDAGSDKNTFVGSCHDKQTAPEITSILRDKLSLPIDWQLQCKTPANSFNYLRKKSEDIGILIFMNGVVGQNTNRKLNVQEFRAFTLIDTYAPLIFINSTDTMTGRLFSLLHEIVHIALGKNSFYNKPELTTATVSPLETVCNGVAAELLIPDTLFISHWQKQKSPSSLEKVKALAKLFTASHSAIIRKALTHHFITRQEYTTLTALFLKQVPKNTGSGGNYYATQCSRLDPRVVLALSQSANEGKTSFTDVYRLTNTSRKTFPTILQKLQQEGGKMIE